MKKTFCLTCGILVIVCLLSSCGNSAERSQTGITSLDLSYSTEEVYELFAGELSPKHDFIVHGSSDYSIDDIQFVSENEAVAVVGYESSLEYMKNVYFYIQGTGAGETYIYFQTKDGIVQSDKIKVIVSQNLESISLADENELALRLGDGEYKNSFSINSMSNGTFQIDFFDFISDNPDIATFELVPDTITYNPQYRITPVNQGETYVYMMAKDGTVQSNKIKVIISEKAEPLPSSVAESTPPSTEEKVNSQQESINKSTSKTVYVTPSGKKYHFSEACAGKNAIESTLDQASTTREPCKKCAQ